MRARPRPLVRCPRRSGPGRDCGVEESIRAVRISHRTHTAPVTAANTSGTLRQLPPAMGRMTLLAAASATACPTTGPVTKIPVALARSLSPNQLTTSLGAPLEIIGAPRPKMPTATNSVIPPVASPRSTPERPISTPPASSAQRSPMRSSRRPHGSAAKMNTAGQVPRMAPRRDLLSPRSSPSGVSTGASDATTRPKATYIAQIPASRSHRRESGGWPMLCGGVPAAPSPSVNSPGTAGRCA